MESLLHTGHISDSWVVNIEDLLVKEIEFLSQVRDVPANAHKSIFRVAERARQEEKMGYRPESISLGLLHRPGKHERAKRGEALKLQLASAFLATIFMSQPIRQKSLRRLATNPALRDRVKELEAEEKTLEANGSMDFMKFNGRIDETSVQRCVEVATMGLRDHAWKEICDSVVGDLEEVKQFYILKDADEIREDESPEVLKCALTLDAIAIATVLGIFYFKIEDPLFPLPLFSERIEESGTRKMMDYVLDFVKLENQIPLCLVRKVMHILHNENKKKGDEALSSICAHFVKDFGHRFLPGYDHNLMKPHIQQLEEKGTFLKCEHLLDCISLVLRHENDRYDRSMASLRKERGHEGNITAAAAAAAVGHQKKAESGKPLRLTKWISSLRGTFKLPEEGSERSSDRWSTRPATTHELGRNINIPSATSLHEAGVDFRHRTSDSDCDLLPVFKPGFLKAKLYIPRLPRMSPLTMVVWKNLVAYEARVLHFDLKRESQLLAITAFMDSLIDTKEDVLLMTKGQNPVLPDRYSSQTEALAKVFNTSLVGFPIPQYPRWLALKREIFHYHNQTSRKMVLDFMRTNFGKPWLVISVVAAMVLLVLSALQTIYTMLPYYIQYP